MLWARPDAVRAAPDEFTWTAYGWRFTDGDLKNRIELAGDDEPRIELGNTYIMAIEWEGARCSPGDYVPAQWRGLGDDSTIPYNDGLIGQGKFEGREQTVDQARESTPSDDPNFSMEDELAGKTAKDLSAKLTQAKPGEKESFGPSGSSTTCEQR